MRTVSNEIISALKRSKLIDDPCEARYQAASRTDRGVNALEQTIAFTTSRQFSLGRLNAFLPEDIKGWAWAETHIKFNPRKEAKERIYLYIHTYSGENVKTMKKAAKKIVEKYIYGIYYDKYDKLQPKKLRKIRIAHRKNHILLYFHSKSFIREQIRRLASLLIKIGAGAINFKQITYLLGSRGEIPIDYPLASPENLALLEIKYNFKFNFDKNQKTVLSDKFRADIRDSKLKEIYLKKIYDT